MIEAKVAAILTSRTLVVSAGSADGVSEDDIVTVVEDVEVRDPDSSEYLGVVRQPRIKLRVREVQERLAVAMTFETVRYPSGVMPATLFANREPQLIAKTQAQVDYRTVLVPIGSPALIDTESDPPPDIPTD